MDRSFSEALTFASPTATQPCRGASGVRATDCLTPRAESVRRSVGVAGSHDWRNIDLRCGHSRLGNYPVPIPLLGACHTTAGAGEDLSATGHVITHSADKNTP